MCVGQIKVIVIRLWERILNDLDSLPHGLQRGASTSRGMVISGMTGGIRSAGDHRPESET